MRHVQLVRLGRFNLSLTRLLPPLNATPIAPGQVLSAQQILPVTDADVFGFNAGVGDMLRLVATRTSNVGNPSALKYEVPTTRWSWPWAATSRRLT
jgi:hypothetical protein